MSVHRALAPAKVNLGLFLGERRPQDGRHELVTVMQSISLADELTLEPAGGEREDGGDELVCEGVDGPPEENLALRALRAFRASTGWDAPRQRLRIEKRIPVAAGLGGGSADAAAALRLARHASGLGDEALLRRLAGELGADVPAQVSPGCWLATGAGERLRRLADPGDAFALLILPADGGLSTGAVYEEADRLAIARSGEAMEAARRMVEEAWGRGVPFFGAASSPGTGPGPGSGSEPGEALLHNDLQQPAVLLRPEILDRLTRARARECDWTFVGGSGPTVVGLYAAGPTGVTGEGRTGGTGEGPAARARARAAAELPSGAGRPAVWAEPVGEEWGRAWTEGEGDPGEADSPADGAVRHNHGQRTDE
jgi:4-diphosphocytidyl-2-C-methyl-D-erythritol kinase